MNREAARDDAAFEAFYDKTARPLRAYILRVTAEAGRADDLLQETYYRFLRTPPTASTERERVSFLYKVATNIIYDHWRRSGRERRGLLEMRPPRAHNDVPRDDVLVVFQKMKARERALLWLAYVEGRSHEEIAAIVGVKARSVRVLLFRARRVLAHLLKQKGLGPEVVP